MKTWLEKNRVYFETIAPVLISIAALFVSVSSFILTNQQLNLAKVEHQPNFYLKESYLFDSEKGFANETELRIINSGAEVSNFNKKVISFLELEFYADKGRHISHIPVYGYYDTTFKETEPKGEIALIKGHMNNSIFNDLYKKTSTQEFRKKYGNVFIRMKHAVHISYINKLGENREEYFVNNLHATKEQFNNLLNIHNQPNIIDFKKITPQQIGENVLNTRFQLGLLKK